MTKESVKEWINTGLELDFPYNLSLGFTPILGC